MDATHCLPRTMTGDTATIPSSDVLQRLKNTMLSLLPHAGDYGTAIKGLSICRRDREDRYFYPMVYEPVFLVIVQGAKKVRMGAQELLCGENSYFVAGVDMPTTCAITDVSHALPYLSLMLKLDRGLLAQLADEMPPVAFGQADVSQGAMTAGLDADFLDALLRLAGLLQSPKADTVLARLIVSEIHYRLLTGPFGAQLRALGAQGSAGNNIAKAILWLRENYDKSLKIEDLARRYNMAVPTLHRHFKKITGMSPLQFQKRLRLEQAHRLLLHQQCDVGAACFAVGYASPQQFSREYKRLFGYPPQQVKTRRLACPLMQARHV